MQTEKFRALCQMAVVNAKTLDDTEALSVKELYPEWSYLCEIGYTAKDADFKFRYIDESGETKLYKTCQENFIFQSQWIPGQGTSAIYTQIVESQAGTYDDPMDVPDTVPPDSFTYVIGKHYRYNGVIYKCQRAGDEDGKEYSFPYAPDALLNQYFVLA